MKDTEDTVENPFVRGSVYRIRSLGTQQEPTLTTGTFLGFTPFGMGGECLKIELAKDHGEEAGNTRVIPNHMVLSVDVLEQKTAEDKKKDDSHRVYYS